MKDIPELCFIECIEYAVGREDINIFFLHEGGDFRRLMISGIGSQRCCYHRAFHKGPTAGIVKNHAGRSHRVNVRGGIAPDTVKILARRTLRRRPVLPIEAVDRSARADRKDIRSGTPPDVMKVEVPPPQLR